ncbi:MAG: T9SS type A sorting domain-containing protein [Bacteroidia bacterium]|nr:T9SS type A sorting domain-containing protein [Bacteroidia bacterium]
MKKTILTLALSTLIGGGTIFAQRTLNKNNRVKNDDVLELPVHRTCGAPVMEDPRFEEWMAKGIAELQASGALNQRSTYTIPVVFHIIHNGGAVGSTYNLSAARCSTQIDVLNKDYSGTNTDASNIPSVFQSVKAGDVGIQFCLANQDPSGNTLTEPGIHRIAASTISGLTWSNSGQSTTTIDQTVKPATIWDVTKYLNIWVIPISGGILGYATFPGGTGLSGLSGYGSTTTDGVVITSSCIGTGSGTSAPYNKGRTTVHEVGHWLGLRHIFGDNPSGCGDDYVADTPPQKGGFSGGTNGCNYGCPTHPFQAGQCTGNTNGEMFMNYMDYVDDGCMIMFSAGQKARMVQAMTNGTYRKTLTASAGVRCGNSGPVAPTADFVATPTTIAMGGQVSFTDLSSGAPTSWSWTASPSTGVVFNTATSQNPTATFANAGQYTISLTATNNTGNNTATKTNYIIVNSPSTAPCDTVKNINNTDTLTVYPLSGNYKGYVSGNNGYGDVAKAEFYSSSTLTGRQVTGAVILFYRNGTKNWGTKAGANGSSTGTVTLKMLNKATNGRPGTTVLATQNITLQSIVQTTPVNNVQYIGNPALTYQTPIIYPTKVTFANPVTVNGDFFLSVVLPTTTGDTAVIFQNTVNTTNAAATAWEDQGSGSWYQLDNDTAWGIPVSFAILPTTCPLNTSIASSSTLASQNVSIYPNPNTGTFKVLTTFGEQKETKITITDVVGRVIETRNEKSGNNYIQFDLSKQAGGIYFVTVQSGTDRVTERINILK